MQGPLIRKLVLVWVVAMSLMLLAGRNCSAGFVQLSASSILAAPGDVITITQNVTFEAADVLPGYTLGGFDVALFYDTTRFSLSNVRLGSLVASNFAGSEQFNTATAGQLTGLASTSNFAGVPYSAGTTGALLQFDLTVKTAAPAGPGEINLVPVISGSITDVVLFNSSTFDTLTMNFTRPVTAGFDNNVDINISVTGVPEPGSVALLLVGAAGIAALRRRLAARDVSA